LVYQQYYTCFYSLEKKDNIIIELEDGKILGASSYTVSGRKYSDFKGIPYAKPPVCNIKLNIVKIHIINSSD
jgi:hypothetical protein